MKIYQWTLAAKVCYRENIILIQKDEEKKKKENHDEEESSIKSGPGTTHTTDPQEHMKGPVSSLMQEIGKAFLDEDVNKSDNK